MKLAKLSGGPEIFHSVQGEGPSSGLPSVFVRSSLCNLYCIWCDTDYTWNWVGTRFRHERDADPSYRKYEKRNQIIELSPQEVVDAVMAYSCRNIVLTGGEPLIQQDDFRKVMTALRATTPDYRFEVETNGTLVPERAFHECIDQYNVSVKLNNSAVPAHLRENPQAVEFFANEGAFFKFVIQDERDLEEVDELAARYRIRASAVYLMPQGQTSQAVRERSVWLVEICKSRGYHFSDRLQIHLYGERRGT